MIKWKLVPWLAVRFCGIDPSAMAEGFFVKQGGVAKRPANQRAKRCVAFHGLFVNSYVKKPLGWRSEGRSIMIWKTRQGL